jgi:hypothetical protein
MNPFRGIFPAQTIQGGSTLDVSAFVTMIAYSLLAYIISAFVDALGSHTRLEEHTTFHQPHYH